MFRNKLRAAMELTDARRREIKLVLFNAQVDQMRQQGTCNLPFKLEAINECLHCLCRQPHTGGGHLATSRRFTQRLTETRRIVYESRATLSDKLSMRLRFRCDAAVVDFDELFAQIEKERRRREESRCRCRRCSGNPCCVVQ